MKKLYFILLIVLNLQAEIFDHIEDKVSKEVADKIDTGVSKAIEESKTKTVDDLNGFLLGISASIKQFDFQQIIQTFQNLSLKTPSLSGGIVIGYQHFFNQYAGIRLTANASVGTYTAIDAQTLVPASSIPSGARLAPKISQVYLPVQAGVDIKFLSTFYRNEKHAFGMSAGVGYDAEWYVLKKADSSRTQGALKNIAQEANSLINQGIYPEIGIYYCYGGNQFELNYRFAHFSFGNTKYNRWNFDNSGSSLPAKTRFLFTGEFILSYLYRF